MNKRLPSFIGFAALTIIAPFYMQGQQARLQVVDKPKVHRQMTAQDNNYKMVALQGLIPGIQYQLAYATPFNFTRKQLYPDGDKTFLRLPAAKALNKAAESLAAKGLGIIVWDAYRPYQVTKKMWHLIRDERYVANPSKGSGHNRGIAIDLTLYDLKTGEPLDMGTGFDHFSDTAHYDFPGLQPHQQQNRALLRKAMEAYGFKVLPTDWWHYSWQGETFPVLNLSFRQLSRLDN